MATLVEHFGSPMINQGMQQTISVFNLGGVVQHFSSPTGNPISTFGNPISAFADGGSTDTDNSEQAKDLRDIKSLINEYRNCLMQKAICSASDRMMQSHVYKQKAMECKLRASKLIDSYNEKYGAMENSPFTMVDMDEMNQYADGGEMVIRYSVYDEEGDLVEMGLTASELIELASTIYYYDAMDSDEENISTLDEAMDGFEAMGYRVTENEYVFANGGSLGEDFEVVVRTPKGLIKKTDFEGFSKKEIVEWCEMRGWKYNPKAEKFGGQALKEYEFFVKESTKYSVKLPKKANGGEFGKRVKFVNDYYQAEVDDLKRRGNYFGFNRERVAKGYKRNLKTAQKGQEFDDFMLEAAYQSKMNNKEFADGGVTKNLKRIVRKGTKYGKIAVNKAKPKAKKIIRKAKLGFDALAKKVAQAYEGKKVAPKYQKQYGKTYSKQEAQEVGNKVAAKVKMMKGL